MAKYLLILAFLAAAVPAGCAEEAREPRMSYGPPSYFHSTAPGMPSLRSTTGWTATDEHYRSATPPPFKGY